MLADGRERLIALLAGALVLMVLRVVVASPRLERVLFAVVIALLAAAVYVVATEDVR